MRDTGVRVPIDDRHGVCTAEPPDTSLADRICKAMLHNAGLFLKKAAEEIAGHAGAGADPFNADRTTLVTVLTQVAVEL